MNQQLLATEFEISVSEPANSLRATGNSSKHARQPPSTVRVGAVSYLNSKPLVEDLQELNALQVSLGKDKAKIELNLKTVQSN